MPELPEVETVKNSILPAVRHKLIEKVAVNHSDVLKNCQPHEFQDYLTGESIDAMERRGKYLIFRLSHGKSMVMHLRMTGQCVYFTGALPETTHCHVVLHFSDGGLYYRDVRRFGGFWIGDDVLALGSGLEHLGPEPLSEDFNSQYLKAQVEKKHAPIKSILLDQRVVAGIGNIYADEISFAAGVNPLKCGCELSQEEIEALVQGTKDILTLAIAKRGTTFSDYRDGYGDKGNFQNYLQIFQKSGEPCVKCGSIIQKTKCAGRGTSFCPQCQPYGSRRLIIGLTGGIACGKTLAANYLHSLGAEIIDADIVAREIMDPGSKVLAKIASTFGSEYIDREGNLRRDKLREAVFQNPAKVQQLNAITHPAIRRRIGNYLKKSENKIVVLVAPLLLEAKFNNICDEVWLLYATEEQQLKRLISRDGIGEEAAKNIISNQWPYAKKAKYADLVIDNTQDMVKTEKQIEDEYRKRKKLLE